MTGHLADTSDIGIIGAGRFGTYFAAQLERVGYRVQRADVRHDSAVQDTARACASPIVIYAVPIRDLERVILETRSLLASDAVVMDVCSVKIIPCEILERHLAGSARGDDTGELPFELGRADAVLGR